MNIETADPKNLEMHIVGDFNINFLNSSLLAPEVSICAGKRRRRDLCLYLTRFLSRMTTSNVHHVISNRFLREQLGNSKTYRIV
jgi:hypothetical protein